jgi:DNA-binding cell septation regulator SpoVG
MITQDREKVKQVSHNNSTQQAKDNPYSGKVTVTAIRPCHQEGPVKAFANVKFGEAIEIFGAKVVQQPGQRAWVALPDRKSPDGNGYFPVVKALDERLAEEISRVVLAAWQNGGAA